jgi:hypothetical protein
LGESQQPLLSTVHVALAVGVIDRRSNATVKQKRGHCTMVSILPIRPDWSEKTAGRPLVLLPKGLSLAGAAGGRARGLVFW